MLVATAAVVLKLRFAVGEKSLQREPLVSRRDKSFTMPVCRKLLQESRQAVCCSWTFD